MTYKSINGHVAETKAPVIYKAWRTIFEQMEISYFCYTRRYNDGRITFLPSNFDCSRYFFGKEVFPYIWFSGIPFQHLQSGYTFWDIARRVSPPDRNIGTDLASNFGLSCGIEIIQKYDHYCDFYCFASKNANIYFIPIQQFYQYIFYFKQECQLALQAAHEAKLLLPRAEVALSPIPIINADQTLVSANKSLDIKRYYLEGEYRGVFLTRREVEILRLLDSGAPVKSLANKLNISTRTFEHHITNIKDKLNVSRANEVLNIARSHHIIT